MIGMPDLVGALQEVRPSIGGWLESRPQRRPVRRRRREYAELRTYLKKAKRL